MKILKATLADIDNIMNIVHSAIIHMESQNINQWDDIYPNKEVIVDDILGLNHS